MPLTEREREELAKKIDQQRKAMWKGQTTRKPDNQKARKPESQKTRKPESQKARKPENQTTRKPENQTTRKPDNQKARKPENQTTRKPDNQKAKEQRQDEREELVKKIKQQRRAVWKGEPATRSKKPRSARSISKVLHQQEESELAEQHAASHSNQQETEEKNREYRSKAPHLKLALIVIIGLIGAIALGIAIGYLAAARGLINV